MAFDALCVMRCQNLLRYGRRGKFLAKKENMNDDTNDYESLLGSLGVDAAESALIGSQQENQTTTNAATTISTSTIMIIVAAIVIVVLVTR